MISHIYIYMYTRALGPARPRELADVDQGGRRLRGGVQRGFLGGALDFSILQYVISCYSIL